jgi:hypothetical protein
LLNGCDCGIKKSTCMNDPNFSEILQIHILSELIFYLAKKSCERYIWKTFIFNQISDSTNRINLIVGSKSFLQQQQAIRVSPIRESNLWMYPTYWQKDKQKKFTVEEKVRWINILFLIVEVGLRQSKLCFLKEFLK